MLKRILVTAFGLALFTWMGGSPALAYKGKLQCKNLDENMRYFSRLHVGRLCSAAVRDCDNIKNLEKLKADDPLRQDIEEDLRKRLKLRLEVCELAIYARDPDFYDDNLKRSKEDVTKKEVKKQKSQGLYELLNEEGSEEEDDDEADKEPGLY